MPSLPASTAFTDSSVTEGGFKTAISDQRAYLAGLLGTDGTTATALSTLGAGFPSGTRMVFQQTTAPTGWTKQTTAALNDSIMRIVTGTASSGGSTAFSTWSAQTATGATTLTTSQIPSHQHFVVSNTTTAGIPLSSSNYMAKTNSDVSGTSDAYTFSGSATASSIGLTSSAGSGSSHTHPVTRSLKYYDFIVAQRD